MSYVLVDQEIKEECPKCKTVIQDLIDLKEDCTKMSSYGMPVFFTKYYKCKKCGEKVGSITYHN